MHLFYLLLFSMLHWSYGSFSESSEYYWDSKDVEDDYKIVTDGKNGDTNEIFTEEYSDYNITNGNVTTGIKITNLDEINHTTENKITANTVATVSIVKYITDRSVVYTPVPNENDNTTEYILSEEIFNDTNVNSNTSVDTNDIVIEVLDTDTVNATTQAIELDPLYVAYDYLYIIAIIGIIIILTISTILICRKIRRCKQSRSYIISNAAGFELKEGKRK